MALWSSLTGAFLSSDFRAYVTSLHFLPFAVSAGLYPFLYYHGFHQSAMIVLYSGLAATVALAWIMPVLTLAPLGGMYRVGVRELESRRDKQEGYPPVTVLYATEAVERERVKWLPFEDSGYLKGMAAYGGVPAFLLNDWKLIHVEAEENKAPLTLFRKDGSQRPIFVFSHGLAGYTRLYYSLLSSIASYGAVVIGVTHTDKSAAFCRDASNDFRLHLDTSLQWTYEDRYPQLQVRIEEMQRTVENVLNGTVLRLAGFPEEDVERYVKSKNPQVLLLGHSFGGATVLATAHEEEKKARRGEKSMWSALAGVVAYDPWCVPLRHRFVPASQDSTTGESTDKLYDEKEATYSVPTVLHHSEAWYLDADSWGYFTAMDAAMHAQLGKPKLLTAAQRKRIEEANERMAKGMVAPPGAQEGDTVAAPQDGDGRNGDQQKPNDWFVTLRAPGTGHLSYTDIAMLSPVVFKKSYQTNKPEVPLSQWAGETMRFAELHVEASLNL